MTDDVELSSGKALTERSRLVPALRPGGVLLEASPEKIHIAFTNHTVTFTSILIVNCVKALLLGIKQNSSAEDLVAFAAERTTGSTDFVRHVLNMLENADCLFWRDPSLQLDNDPLSIFLASIGEAPDDALARLARCNINIVTTGADNDRLRTALRECGLSAAVEVIEAGMRIGDVERLFEARPEPKNALLACWGLQLRSPAAQVANARALSGGPMLFGACEGVVGRIGPFVIPGVTPCLECLHARFTSNGGPEEMGSTLLYRAKTSDEVPEPAPAHPAFRTMAVSLFALELARIASGLPSRTAGGFLECSAGGTELVRRGFLRVPGCAACARSTPPRFAWNAAFISPTVKGGGIET